ncbi:hypothetical protein EDB87DRAFT_1761498 [Lactarius vividus]|nr:hypothetical protein EDB87DRAFT_1761498 [Lactarius vividus]
MRDDFLLSLPSEGVRAELPAFLPSLQAAPEAFEKYLDDNFGMDDHFPSLDELSRVFPDIPTSPALGSSSKSIYTTESSAGPATSDYTTFSTSNHPAHFDFGSQLNAVDPKRIMFSDLSAFPDFDFSGLQLSPTLFQNVCVTVAETQYADGPDQPPVGIPPYTTLSTDFQSPPPPYPTDPPVCATSTTQSCTGPIRTKHTCPHCGLILTSGRESNLKAHIETHNPNRKKPFVCPENDCGHPFARRNDLKRHMQSQHGDQGEVTNPVSQRVWGTFEHPGMVNRRRVRGAT